MPVTVPCPACGATLNAPDHFVGKKVKCPKCQSPVVVADPAAADDGFEVVDKPPPKKSAKPAPTRPRVADDDEDDDRPRKKKPARDEDDDDEPVSAKSRKKAARDDDDEDEDEEDDRPRKKKKKKAKGGVPVWVWPAAAVAVLGIGVGVYFAAFHKSGDGKTADGKAGDAKAGDAKGGGGKPAAPVWGKLDGPDGDFAAEFPGGPPGAGDLAALITAQGGNPGMAADMEKTLAAVGIKLQIWTRQDGGRTYLLQVMTFPPAAAGELAGPNGLNTVVAGIKQSTGKQPGTVVASETDSTFGGRPGKLLVIRNAAAGKGGVFNLTLSGATVYTMTVAGDATLTADDPTVKQFFEKFSLKK